MQKSDYRIFYKKSVGRDLKGIDITQKKRIIKKIEVKLSREPYRGKALKGEYQGYWDIRVGDYRVAYKVAQKDVVILAIGHRKDIYKRPSLE